MAVRMTKSEVQLLKELVRIKQRHSPIPGCGRISWKWKRVGLKLARSYELTERLADFSKLNRTSPR
jgi:hypothetical protein